MTFELKPGDYVMASDIESEEMNNAIREAFRKAGCAELSDKFTRDFSKFNLFGNPAYGWIGNSFVICGSEGSALKRRVYPRQILTKPMLIEALKPGMRAILPNGKIVHSKAFGIVDESSNEPIWNTNALMLRDYEIISDDPKPWEPTREDMGFIVTPDNCMVDSVSASQISKSSLRTKQAAEQMAKIMRVYTAIMNMPGAHDGNNAHVWVGAARGVVLCSDDSTDTFFETPFDTFENAQAAAKEANRIIEEME